MPVNGNHVTGPARRLAGARLPASILPSGLNATARTTAAAETLKVWIRRR
jgi:hypothetical protein